MSYEESTQCRQGIGRGLRDDVLCTLVTRGPDLDASSKTVEGFLVKSTACSPSLPQAGYGNRAMQLPQRAPPCSWTSLASNGPGILFKARRPFSCTRGPPCQGPKWDNGPPSPSEPLRAPRLDSVSRHPSLALGCLAQRAQAGNQGSKALLLLGMSSEERAVPWHNPPCSLCRCSRHGNLEDQLLSRQRSLFLAPFRL